MSRPTDNGHPEPTVPDGELYETEIGDRLPSEALVDVVAAIRDVEPASLTPLYEAVDPDALDSLCTNSELGAKPTIRFTYEGLTLTVSADGVITVVEA